MPRHKQEKGADQEELTDAQKEIVKNREVVDIIVQPRINRKLLFKKEGKNLVAPEETEGEEIFKEVAKKLLEELVVHGIVREGTLKRESDLDGEMAIKLFELAGIDISKLDYKKQGESEEGKVMVDTGNEYGLVRKGKSLYFDHHGAEAKNDTCATKIVYESMIRLGLLEKNEILDKTVNFVNQVDNETFDLNEKKFRNLDKSLYGYDKFIEPEALIKFFEEGGKSTDTLSEAKIRKLGLGDRIEEVRGKIKTAIDFLEKNKKNDMIADGIVVDFDGKMSSFGFRAAKAFGYKAYLNWSPKRGSGSFFLSTIGELKPKFSQGVDMRGRHMWVKPPHDPERLKVTLNEILSKLTDGKFKAKGELKKYLDKEVSAVDLSSADDRINEEENLSQKNMAETRKIETPNNAETLKDIEREIFQEQESKVVESMTKEYAKTTKIDKTTKDTINGFLDQDTEEVYREFALKWFEDHKSEMKSQGRIIEENASKEWKINMVLSKGGMDARADIDNPEYEGMKDKLDRIRILRTDMKGDQPPPETPFLLLEYLQTKVDKTQEDVDNLKAEQESGDAGAEIMVRGKEAELKKIKSTMRDLAGKAMGEDLQKDAEKKVDESGFPIPKEEYIRQKSAGKKETIEDAIISEKEEKEWQRFDELDPRDKIKYQKSLGGNSRFPLDKDRFIDLISQRARENGVEGPAFYKLLEQGFRPHEIAKREPWKIFGRKIFGKEIIIMPKENGSPKESTAEEFNDIIEDAKNKYTEEIDSQTRKELEKEWKKMHDDQVNSKVEERIAELVLSPYEAVGSIEGVYQRARERIVTEYALGRINRDKKSKSELAAIEKEFGKKEEEVNVKDFVSDVLHMKGGLEGLDGAENDGKKMITDYLESFDMSPTKTLMNGIPALEYANAKKGGMPLLNLIMRIMGELINPAPRKRAARKTK